MEHCEYIIDVLACVGGLIKIEYLGILYVYGIADRLFGVVRDKCAVSYTGTMQDYPAFTRLACFVCGIVWVRGKNFQPLHIEDKVAAV